MFTFSTLFTSFRAGIKHAAWLLGWAIALLVAVGQLAHAQNRLWYYAGSYDGPPTYGQGYAGDGLVAFTSPGQGQSVVNRPPLVKLYYPSSIAFDAQGHMYIADENNQAIRKVNYYTHVITTIAGTPTVGVQGPYSGPAASTGLYAPRSIVYRAADNSLYAAAGNGKDYIIKLDLNTNTITTIAGNGVAGLSSGDGGPALSATLNIASFSNLAFDATGQFLYIIDTGGAGATSFILRKIDLTTNTITKVADLPISSRALTLDPSNNAYFVCQCAANNRFLVKKITPGGVQTTLAGGGPDANSADGGDNVAGTTVRLLSPAGVAFDTGYTNLYFTDNGVVRKLNLATGILSKVVGDATYAASGNFAGANQTDGELATEPFSWNMNQAMDVQFNPKNGLLYVTDKNAIFQVSPAAPAITPEPVCAAGTTAPALSATTKSNVCPATTVDLSTITASNTPANTTLTWHSGTPATSANKLSSVNAVGAGTYYAAFYDATNDCYSGTGSATTQVTASVTTCAAPCTAGSTAPALSATTKSNVCPATTVDLSTITASNTPGGTTLTWHSGTPATTANKLSSVNAVAAGTYYAAFFDATNNCYSGTGGATTQVTASVNTCNSCPTTAPALSATTRTINCFAGTTFANLNAYVTSTAPSGAVLQWTTGGVVVSNPTSVTAAGTYTATYYNATLNCSSPGIDFTVVTTPIPTLSTTSIAICPPATTADLTGIATLVPAVSGFVVEWWNDPDGANPVSNSAAVPVGTYHAYAYNPTTGCYGATPSPTVTVANSAPSAPTGATASPASICSGANSTLSASCSTGTLQWYSDAGLTTSISNVVSPGGTTTYYGACVSGSCKSSSIQVSVTVNTPPATPTLGAPTQPTCSVATGTFTITNYDATATYTFSPAGPTQTNGTVTASPGTYTVTASKSGCTSGASSPVTINTQPGAPATPTLGAPTQPTCSVATGTFSISNYDASATYTISPSAGVSQSGATITAPAGTYTVQATLSGCTSGPSQGVTLNPPVCQPTVAITTPNNVTTTNTNPPVSGTATALASVTVNAPNNQVCITTANASGNWTCSSLTFTVGSQTVTAIASNTGGVSTVATANFTVVSSCANPSVGGTVAYGGTLPLCNASNAGTLLLSGNTGSVVKWQTSTDGGTTWTDLAGTSGKTYYSFINAANNQQYRAVVNTGSAGCGDANSAPVTITTSAGVCSPVACDKTAGSLTFTATPAVSGTNFSHVIIMTDGSGVIQYASAPGSSTVTAAAGGPVASGTYLVYLVSYDNTLSPVPTLTVGTSLSGIGGNCVAYSGQLPLKVCAALLPPVAVSDIANTNINTPVSDNVLTNDKDPQGGPLTAGLLSQPASGTVVLNPNGSYTYTPPTGFTGIASFCYSITNTAGLSSSACVTVNVNPVPSPNPGANNPPIAANDATQTTAGMSVTVVVLANDTDPDSATSLNGQLNTPVLLAQPATGTAVVNANGTMTYTPPAGFTGVVSFPYQVCDKGTSQPSCATALVTVDVQPTPPANTTLAPVAVDDALTTRVNVPKTGTVADNDSDPQGLPLTFTGGQPVSGTVVMSPNGSYTYTPPTGFEGPTSFTYSVCNSAGKCTKATVSVLVQAPPALPPVVKPDIANTNINTPVPGNVLTNDVDPQGGPLTVSLLTPPTTGTVTITPTGNYTYTPPTGFTGVVSFCYTASNTAGLSASTCVTVNVNPVPSPITNNPPVANADATQTTQGTPVIVAVLANDTDPDSATSANGQLNNPTLLSQPSTGTAVVNANGTVTYTPPANFTGVVSFPYQVCDKGTSQPSCATALVTVNVQPTPPSGTTLAPVAVDDALLTQVNVPKAGTVATNDSDPQGLPLTFTTGQPTSGTVVMSPNGSYTYTPAPGYVGPDSFTYNVCNSASKCTKATVSVDVQPLPVNQPPLVTSDVNTFIATVPTTGNVLTNDKDPEGTPLTASLIGTPPTGFTLSPDGSYTYTAPLSQTAPVTLVYQACDRATPPACATTTLTLTPVPTPSPLVNDAPIALNDATRTTAGVSVTVNVRGNDRDPEGLPLSNPTLVSQPTTGTALVNPDGTVTYTPPAGFTGVVSFPYQVCDTGTPVACATAVVTVTVDPTPPASQTNLPPVAIDDALLTTKNVSATGTVAANDSDPNVGQTLTFSTLTTPATGTVVFNANGSYTYTPPTGFVGTTNFVYQVCDNGSPVLCTTATAYITVSDPGNLPPVVTPDIANTNKDTPVSGNVVTNDVDPQGGPLTVSLLTPPTTGTVTITPTGTYTYTPPTGFTGTVSFCYSATNTVGLSASACVTINVLPDPSPLVNDKPIANNDATQTTQGTPVIVAVLANDTDPDSATTLDGQLNNPTLLSQPSVGTAVVNANGTVTYTPPANFTGVVTFPYQVCDKGTSQPSCATALVTVNVQPTPPANTTLAPVAVDDALLTQVNVPKAGTVAANDSDPQGLPLTFTGGQPVSGTVVMSPNGSYTYTPPTGFVGPTSFTYSVCNSAGKCDVATVSVDVQSPGSNPPVVIGRPLVTTPTDPVTVCLPIVDADQPDSFTASICAQPASGTLTASVNNATGSPDRREVCLTYTPVGTFNGPLTACVGVCDSQGNCTTAVVPITVTPPSQTAVTPLPPLVVVTPISTPKNTSATVCMPIRDPNGSDTHTVTVCSVPGKGTATASVNNTTHEVCVIYTPTSGSVGQDKVCLTICDQTGLCTTVTVPIQIVDPTPPGPGVEPPVVTPTPIVTVVDKPVTVCTGIADSGTDSHTATICGLPDSGTATVMVDNASHELCVVYRPGSVPASTSVCVEVCDQTGQCTQVILPITVLPVNQPPVVRPDIANTTINTPVPGNVLTNDKDPQGGPLTVSLLTPPTTGTVTISPTGNYTYTPPTGFTGVASFCYSATNTAGLSASTCVTVNVNPVPSPYPGANNPPIAANDATQTTAGTSVTVVVLANDTDPDSATSLNGQLNNPVLLGQPATGTAVVNANGSVTYTPPANFTGVVSFPYSVCDKGTSQPSCATALVTVDVQPTPPANTTLAPVAVDDALTTRVNVPKSGTVADNDSDPQGLPLTFTGGQPVSGTVVMSPNGSYTYTPPTGFEGPTSFTYSVCNSAGKCTRATVSVLVQAPPALPPVVKPDIANTNINTLVSGNVLTNDVDPQGGPLTVSLLTPPTTGTVTISPTGNYTYTPPTGFTGTASFCYSATSTAGLSGSTCVTVNVNPIPSPVSNDKPVANNDATQTTQGTPVVVAVLANDTDPDSATTLDGQLNPPTLISQPSVGTAVVNANGTVTYTPPANFTGVVTFPYQVCDKGASQPSCATALVTVNVQPTPPSGTTLAPVAVDDALLTQVNVPKSGTVATNDSDPQGLPLTFTSGQPVSGTVVMSPNGSYTYTPALGYVGPDSFTYAVCNSAATCTKATVSVDVQPVPQPPVVIGEPLVTTIGKPATLCLPIVDADQPDSHTASICGQPASGVASVSVNNLTHAVCVIYTPTATFTGPTTVCVQVCDSYGLCTTTIVPITVQPASQTSTTPKPPVVVVVPVVTPKNTPVTVCMTVVDPNLTDTHSVSVCNVPGKGTATASVNNTTHEVCVTYTPTSGSVGPDAICLTVCDQTGLCTTVTVPVQIVDPTPPGDGVEPPVVTPTPIVTVPNKPVTVVTGITDSLTDSHTATICGGPASGTAQVGVDNVTHALAVTYTPGSSAPVNTTLCVTVCDQTGQCTQVILPITVLPVNQPPVLTADIANTNINTPVPGNVLTNDKDPQGAPLTVSLLTPPTTGTVTLTPTGNYTYTPPTGFTGTASFCYSATNTVGLSASTCLTINVLPDPSPSANDKPIANNDATQTTAGTPVIVAVLANDTDPDSATTLDGQLDNPTLVSQPSVGTAMVNANGTVTYTPPADFTGVVSFPYSVCDKGTSQPSCATALVTVNVQPTPPNGTTLAPVAVDDALLTQMNVPKTGEVWRNDSDPQGLPLTFTTGQPVSGTVVMSPNGSYTYTPPTGFEGPTSFTYSVCNSAGKCTNATVSVLVQAPPALLPPIATSDIANTNINTPVSDNVLTNDVDPQGNPLTVSLISQPISGTVSLLPDGTYVYTPPTDFTGVASFCYAISNTAGLSSSACVSVNVNPAPSVLGNNKPIANNDNTQTTAGVAVTIKAIANDTDPDAATTPDGQLNNPTLIAQPSVGTAVVNANGSVTYTPPAGFTGVVSFPYQVCDKGTSQPSCATALITVNVQPTPPANTTLAPVAVDDALLTRVNVPKSGDVSANDSDPQGLPLTFTSGQPASGTVVMSPNGSYTYTPPTGFVGPTSFLYLACNSAGKCDVATVSIDVQAPTGLPPVVTPDIANTNKDTPVTGNVVTNDKDPQGGPLTVSLLTPPTTGTVTISPTGNYTYTPPTGFTGTASFCYSATNTAGLSASTCVTVNVLPTPSPTGNNAPVANNDATQTTAGTSVTIAVLANDTDPDSATSLNGQLSNPTILAQPAQGTAVVNANGTVTYTPPAGLTGVVTFPYQVCDKATPALCTTALVSVDIQPTPPVGTTLAPVAIDDALLTQKDTPKTGTVATNDSDPQGLPLTFTTGQPTSGTVVMSPNGSYTYTPAPGYVGPTSFTYSVCNSAGKCDVATVSVDVQSPVNLPPVVTPDVNTFIPGKPTSGNVLTNDKDPEGTPLTATVIGTPPAGFTMTPDGSYTYTAPLSQTAPVSLTVNVCDSATPPACTTSTLTLTPVLPPTPGNDAPIALNDAGRTTAGTSTTVNVLGNDKDPEGLPLSNPTIVSQPAQGTATVNPDGTITYTPPTGFTGVVTFPYQVCDTGSPVVCTTALVTMTIDPTLPAGVTNVAPVAIDDNLLTTKGTPATGTVASNDRDPNPGQTLTFTKLTNPTNGTVVFNADGSYTYTPAPGFVGTDHFVYQVCDSGSPVLCTTATAYQTVSDVPTLAPVLTPDIANTNKDTPVTGNVVTNDKDPQGGPLTVSLLTPPTTGTVTLTPTGSYTYTPPTGFTGTVSFCYSATNTAGLSASTCVSITVNPVPSPLGNNPPIADNDASQTTAGTPVIVAVLANDTDPDSATSLDGQLNNPTLIAQPSVGTAVVNANGTVTYTPPAGFTGVVSFPYSVCDKGTSQPSCATALVTVNVQPTPPSGTTLAPVAVDDALLTKPNVPKAGTVATNDSDPQGLPLTYAGGQPTSGTVVMSPNGSYTYTPAPGYVGPASFTYTVCNSAGKCTNATVNVLVQQPIDPAALVLRLKVLLQGALIGGTNNLMRDDLRSQKFLPLTEPYSAIGGDRFTHVNGGGETMPASVTALNVGTGDAIVDWVFVELRSPANLSVVVATRSALVQRDGDVVLASDGVSPLSFTGLSGSSFYVSVKHRNHLGAMTATAIPLSTTGTLVDFTTMTGAQLWNKIVGTYDYEGWEQTTVGNKQALWAGDANHNGKVKYQGTANDLILIFAEVIGTQAGNASPLYNYNNALGYYFGDVNMDGKVKYQGTSNDTSLIFTNVITNFQTSTQMNSAQLYNFDWMLEQLP
ncbi:Ig-like domain-containing protein [Fibrella arboris]|uniref:Ig-like domain-containing protein n=1 Tax=Fibrella arboris TaxID=3242486 RepID=UPI00352031E8